MALIKNATFGSDFEQFVHEDGFIVPCPLSFGGTKKEPLSIGKSKAGECFRQIDNVTAE
jgi:hypothetical protein